MEIKGYCTYGERYSRGVSSEFAAEFMDKMRRELEGDVADHINWSRAAAANRYAYNFKLVMVINEQEDNQNSKDMAYRLKKAVAKLLQKQDYAINKAICYVVVQASPERRLLFQHAGRFCGIFSELSGDSAIQTKREYGFDSLTILA